MKTRSQTKFIMDNKETSVKRDHNLTLIFDVETNGLLTKGQKNIEECPYILQLSFLVYDDSNNEIIKTFNSYVNIDNSVEISKETIDINGITREICNNHGLPIENILNEFSYEYMRCNKIVAHNIDFDKRMIKIEIIRNSFKMINMDIDPCLIFNDNLDKKLYCTMMHGIELCKLPGRYGKYKYPSLSELHTKLFNNIPGGLHDALVDTKACYDCYKCLQLLGY